MGGRAGKRESAIVHSVLNFSEACLLKQDNGKNLWSKSE